LDGVDGIKIDLKGTGCEIEDLNELGPIRQRSIESWITEAGRPCSTQFITLFSWS